MILHLTETPLVHCVKVIQHGELRLMYILHNIDMKIEEPIQYNFPYSDVEVS